MIGPFAAAAVLHGIPGLLVEDYAEEENERTLGERKQHGQSGTRHKSAAVDALGARALFLKVWAGGPPRVQVEPLWVCNSNGQSTTKQLLSTATGDNGCKQLQEARVYKWIFLRPQFTV